MRREDARMVRSHGQRRCSNGAVSRAEKMLEWCGLTGREDARISSEDSRGEKMLESGTDPESHITEYGTDPESYITEYTLVHEDKAF